MAIYTFKETVEEIRVYYYEVEAETPQEAENLVVQGKVDSSSSYFDDYAILDLEQTGKEGN